MRGEGGKKHRGGGIAGRIFRLILLVLCFLALSFGAVPFLGYTVTVESGAMTPELEIGQKVAVNRAAYILFNPRRGDIVQFHADDHESETYIRRVIALPGETVQIMDGKIYINGNVLEEDYTEESIQYAGIASVQLTLGEREYFLLADNRNNNFDSRDPTVGTVDKSSILGRVWIRISPIQELKLL